ncbi:MAG: hypothetical protein QOD06_2767 [Candidatus Binatota bacterium]|nr:hypothetical protein [Candidatus Binatota bacterium]
MRAMGGESLIARFRFGSPRRVEPDSASVARGRGGDVPTVARLVAAGLYLAFTLQAGIACLRDSVTIDEFVHLPVGLFMLRHGAFDADPINPPLSRMLPALPLLLQRERVETPPAVPHWTMGHFFMVQNAERYQELFVQARCVVILMTVALAALVQLWTRQLYGWRASIAALAVFAFSPSLLAHGHLVTADAPGALGFVAVLYATWWLLEHLSVGRAALVGILLGLTILLKLSGAILILVITALVVFSALRAAGTGAAAAFRAAALLAVVVIVAIAVMNLGYGFQGTGRRLSEISLAPGGIGSRIAASAPWIRLPLPAALVRGFDLAGAGEKPSPGEYFFAGERSSKGWWYYHLAAYGLKTPLGFLALVVVALAARSARFVHGPRDYCVYAGIAAVFLANSFLNPLNFGVRHVLAADPLLAIVVSPVIAGAISRAWRAPRRMALARAAAVVLAVGWSAASCLAISPRYLEYFNEIAGGPSRGHEWLVDSNLDWGQDLIRLREYLDRRGLDTVHLAYFGRAHPGVYGVRFSPLEPGVTEGVGVISASFLMGRPYWAWMRPDRPVWIDSGAFDWLARLQPIDRVGSMFVFDLGSSRPRQDAQRGGG